MARKCRRKALFSHSCIHAWLPTARWLNLGGSFVIHAIDRERMMYNIICTCSPERFWKSLYRELHGPPWLYRGIIYAFMAFHVLSCALLRLDGLLWHFQFMEER